jgi:hypothetical protein
MTATTPKPLEETKGPPSRLVGAPLPIRHEAV